MNVHDSEKVIGTLVRQGYSQVETVEEAELVFYNTCSIRDKAEQKVFNRLNDYKSLHHKARSSRSWLRRTAGRRKDFRASASCFAGRRLRLISQPAADAGAD